MNMHILSKARQFQINQNKNIHKTEELNLALLQLPLSVYVILLFLKSQPDALNAMNVVSFKPLVVVCN